MKTTLKRENQLRLTNCDISFETEGKLFFNMDEFPNETDIDTWGKTQESVPLYQAFIKESEDDEVNESLR